VSFTQRRKGAKNAKLILFVLAFFASSLRLCVKPVEAAPAPELDTARDRQDRPALQKILTDLSAAADKAPKDADAQYRAALAASYLAEVALEVRDRPQAKNAAETGIRFADRAIALKPAVSEYHRVLGTLAGQVIPAGNVLTGLSYGKRAKEAINKALELDARSARNWLARGVGNYYLPAALGGGPELAISDFKKAIELDAKSAEAYLWLGLSLRKVHRNAEARQAFQKSLELGPRRVWAKEQLEKTPAS
jgi:tetratricopeptide (TPR) repeat protein